MVLKHIQKPLLFWEVELMETNVMIMCLVIFTATSLLRSGINGNSINNEAYSIAFLSSATSLLRSGINGNAILSKAREFTQTAKPLLFWEVELMETLYLNKLSHFVQSTRPLLFWEVELMETTIGAICGCTHLVSHFSFEKWN